MLSLVWSASALVVMRFAAQRVWRRAWSVGAGLLGVVVAKLFLVDLASHGSMARVVSFVGVGLLMLLIGYLAPFPKRAEPAPRPHRRHRSRFHDHSTFPTAPARRSSRWRCARPPSAPRMPPTPPRATRTPCRCRSAANRRSSSCACRATSTCTRARPTWPTCACSTARATPQPFALTWTAAPQQRSLELPCKVFPIYAPARDGGRVDDLQVRLTRDGTVVSVTPRPDAAPGDAETLAGLVLDLGTLPQGAQVAGLTLAPPPGARNYSAQLIAEASDDLQDWQPLAETTVSWLVNASGETRHQQPHRLPRPAPALRAPALGRRQAGRIRDGHGAGGPGAGYAAAVGRASCISQSNTRGVAIIDACNDLLHDWINPAFVRVLANSGV